MAQKKANKASGKYSLPLKKSFDEIDGYKEKVGVSKEKVAKTVDKVAGKLRRKIRRNPNKNQQPKELRKARKKMNRNILLGKTKKPKKDNIQSIEDLYRTKNGKRIPITESTEIKGEIQHQDTDTIFIDQNEKITYLDVDINRTGKATIELEIDQNKELNTSNITEYIKDIKFLDTPKQALKQIAQKELQTNQNQGQLDKTNTQTQQKPDIRTHPKTKNNKYVELTIDKALNPNEFIENEIKTPHNEKIKIENTELETYQPKNRIDKDTHKTTSPKKTQQPTNTHTRKQQIPEK